MIVDIVTENGKQILRYETETPLKCGETISVLFPTKQNFQIISVDHLIKLRTIGNKYQEELITITVKEY